MENSVHLQGRIGSELELRTTPNGNSTISFRLANTGNYKGTDGTYKTNWINCVAWGKIAEFIVNYFAKGAMLLIDGELNSRDYTDKNGNKVYITEVKIEKCHFTGEKKKAEGGVPPWPEDPYKGKPAEDNGGNGIDPGFAPVAADDDYPF